MNAINKTNDTGNFEGKYRVLKRDFLKLDRKHLTNKIMKYLFVTLTVILLFAVVVLYRDNKKLEAENKYLIEDNVEYAKIIDMYMDTALYFADMSVAMDDTNATLKGIIYDKEEELMAYREREELYDAYEWALYYGGKKTDITYGQIQSLQEYCDEKGYSSEMVDLVLAIAMKESTGHEKA